MRKLWPILSDMGDLAIEAKGLGKSYKIGKVQEGDLRGAITSFLRTKSSKSEETFWALRDLDFKIEKGTAIGVIGKNGAGKSTLLKILSRITEPTKGGFELHGRVSSLLEVGTGFHPELTGRENVFLNGTILGMTRQEVRAKFDEIVEFSGVGKFLETPVKHYSSGMKVRLAFSVAAHLDPEILIIDEVLAVGDAEFQKKCLGKMDAVSKEDGRTILFVSHNLQFIEKLCHQGILLEKGTIKDQGPIAQVLRSYDGGALAGIDAGFVVHRELFDKAKIDGMEVLDIKVSNQSNPEDLFRMNDSLKVEVSYKCSGEFVDPSFVVILKDEYGLEVARFSTMPISGFDLPKLHERGTISLVLRDIPLVSGRYSLDIGFVQTNVEWHFNLERIIEFRVHERDVYHSGVLMDRTRGLITLSHAWQHTEG